MLDIIKEADNLMNMELEDFEKEYNYKTDNGFLITLQTLTKEEQNEDLEDWDDFSGFSCYVIISKDNNIISKRSLHGVKNLSAYIEKECGKCKLEQIK